MVTIDAQVHAYERNHPGRRWAAVLHGPPEVTGDDMVAAMDSVDVDAAILVSPFTMYRYDASYALEVHAAHPGRFSGSPILIWLSPNGFFLLEIFRGRVAWVEFALEQLINPAIEML